MSPPTRRRFLRNTLIAAMAGSYTEACRSAEQDVHTPSGLTALPNVHGNEQVGMLIYPGFTALDLFGPHHFFSAMMGADVHLVARDMSPVSTDGRIEITPTATFATCPAKLTILFVPGGTLGTLAAADDAATLQFLRSRAERAEWVTSVCTGSLVLAAAGLLKGYRATSHWMVADELARFGATPVHERVVVDRNRMTGAGVTAGLDFSLQLVQSLRGDAYAQAVQLFSEYDPAPPLHAGCPAKAPQDIVSLLRDTHLPFNELVRELAERHKPE